MSTIPMTPHLTCEPCSLCRGVRLVMSGVMVCPLCDMTRTTHTPAPLAGRRMTIDAIPED